MSRSRSNSDLSASEKPGMNGDTEKPVTGSPDDGDESDDEETIEESPCGRWLKRREEVHQRNVPGIDNAFLAMDSEEGVEVVWNEVSFVEREHLEDQENKLRRVFENLIQLEHPNIVKFHKYWLDKSKEHPRIVFISEYMSSGSLKQFLKRTKSNLKRLPLQSWKRWCTQIVSALSYLHSCSPPIIHGNLSCDTIFIQHNGLIKIGSVAPDVINEYAKTSRDGTKNRHFFAPEYYDPEVVITTAGDIYSFGICALEMAVLEIQSQTPNGGPNPETGVAPLDDGVRQALEALRKEDPLQLDFIERCLKFDPAERATARQLLFHPILFEVHSLKVLAAHCLVHCANFTPEAVTDEAVQQKLGKDKILAEVRAGEREVKKFRLADIPFVEKLETFMEDVQFGMYPLTAFAFALSNVQLNQSREQAPSPASDSMRGGSGGASTAAVAGAGGGATGRGEHHLGLTRNSSFTSDSSPTGDKQSTFDPETRRIINMVCTMRTNLMEGETGHKAVFSDNSTRVTEEGLPFTLQLSVLLRLEDKMNRQLVCDLNDDDTAESLAADLVRNCLISREDEPIVRGLIAEMMENLATGCTSSASAILDRTDIPASFFESGLMKDLVGTATVTVGGQHSAGRPNPPSALSTQILSSFER